MRYVFLSLLTFVMASCGDASVAERVTSAEMAFAAEDAASSRRICDAILSDTGNAGGITASELCRL